MKALLPLLAALTIAGCHKGPCDGLTAACVELEVTGPALEIDSLNLKFTGSLSHPDYQVDRGGQTFGLPIVVPLIFDSLRTSTQYGLVVQATRSTTLMGSGQTEFTIRPGEHEKWSVALASSGTDLGTASDGGSDLAGTISSDGGSGCPDGMVSVGGYCIDATEVTVAAYQAFLDASPGASYLSRDCASGHSFVPQANWPPPTGSENLPITFVDWCDAYGYCAWAGKRLCGQIGGGSLSASAAASFATSEWVNACTKAGTRTYPYGSSYDKTACNGSEFAPSQPHANAVGKLASCEGGFDGLFDMSGNVAEWIDSCANSGESPCLTMGGSWASGSDSLACSYTMDGAYRSSADQFIGIRCCK